MKYIFSFWDSSCLPECREMNKDLVGSKLKEMLGDFDYTIKSLYDEGVDFEVFKVFEAGTLEEAITFAGEIANTCPRGAVCYQIKNQKGEVIFEKVEEKEEEIKVENGLF